MLFGTNTTKGAIFREHALEQRAKIERSEKSNEANSFLLRKIENYQQNVSPKIKAKLRKNRLCKYEPSCSEYARQAIQKYGSVRGAVKTTKRLIRCNPLSNGGYDPLK